LCEFHEPWFQIRAKEVELSFVTEPMESSLSVFDSSGAEHDRIKKTQIERNKLIFFIIYQKSFLILYFYSKIKKMCIKIIIHPS